jgi:hypothetical protein
MDQQSGEEVQELVYSFVYLTINALVVFLKVAV